MSERLLPGNSGRRLTLLLVLVGIIVAAANLRAAVTGMSPLFEPMSVELGFGTEFLGLMGMLPPLMFGIAGFITPLIMKRGGLVVTAWGSMLLAAAGMWGRLLVDTTAGFAALSGVALLGMGMGNVVLPPLVKTYFPHRVGLLSTVYLAMLQLGTFLPPLLAVPMASAWGWRGSLFFWVISAGVALIPWTVLLLRRADPPRPVDAPALSRAAGVPGPPGPGTAIAGPTGFARLARSPVAWGLALTFAMTSANNYTLFTWLPTIMVRAGYSEAFGGAMLSLFCIVPFFLGLALPGIATRVRNVFPIVVIFCVSLAAGYTGLALAPTAAPVLWTVLAGIGVSTFPLALTLINVRTRTGAGSQALAGFAQGIGYIVAALGPLLFAALLAATGSLGASYAMVAVTIAVKLVAGYFATRPVFVD